VLDSSIVDADQAISSARQGADGGVHVVGCHHKVLWTSVIGERLELE
jgi:hypothetical protein